MSDDDALEVALRLKARELETGRGELLAIFRLATRRAHGERRLRDLLQVLVSVAADVATVLVDRHGARLYS